MKLTKEEQEIILEKRRKEEMSLAYKIGYLKHDLYLVPFEKFDILKYGWLISKEQKEKLIKKLDQILELNLKEGAEFDCYLEEDGTNSWYDQDTGAITGVGDDWAEKHLRDIKIIRKIK